MDFQKFTAQPDIVDDCFLLASRCTRYCPQLLVQSPVLPSLVDCAMKGVTIQHRYHTSFSDAVYLLILSLIYRFFCSNDREACCSILSFLQNLFHLHNTIGGNQYRSTLDSILLPRGQTLCRILIGAVAGAVPESRVNEVSVFELFLV